MSWDWELITRHTYIGITPLWKAVFYGIILSSLGVGVVWYWKRLQLWRLGQPDGEPLPMRTRIQNMLGYALAQKKVPRHRFATLFHLPLYAGFRGEDSKPSDASPNWKRKLGDCAVSR
jgi:hypothetical protein